MGVVCAEPVYGMRFPIEARRSGYTLTHWPSPWEGEGRKRSRKIVVRMLSLPPFGRIPNRVSELLSNGNVILSEAKNPLNSVRIAEEIPPPAEPGLE